MLDYNIEALLIRLRRFTDNEREEFIPNLVLQKFFEKNSDNLTRNQIEGLEEHYRLLESPRSVFRQWLSSERFNTSDQDDIKDDIKAVPQIHSAQSNAKGDKSNPGTKPVATNVDIEGLDKLLTVMKIRRYSHQTIKAYTSALRIVELWLNQRKLQLSKQLQESDFLEFFSELSDKESAASTIRLYRFSIELYFIEVWSRAFHLGFARGVKKNKSLPKTLSQDEVLKVINIVNNRKHRTLLALAYASGLRVSEVVKVKVQDIHLDQLIIRVQQGKGRKDRLSILSEKLLNDLKALTHGKTSRDFLFDSQQGGHLHVRSAQKIFHAAVEKAGIARQVTFHSLRHSFATHLHENGTELNIIQKLLGHKNIATTIIYTKVSKARLSLVKSPY